MILKAGLLLDFGNSATRVIVISGNKKYRFDMSNRFAGLPTGYQINNKYANGASTVFLANNMYYANGQIVDREFSGTALRPSSLQSKTEQLTTELSIHLAIIKALSILSQAYNVPVSTLDVTFTVSALLPPLDHEMNEERLADLFRKVTEVKAVLPAHLEANVKIEPAVNVYSEAVAAFFGAFYFEQNVVENPQNEGKSLEKGDVLVLDSGAHIVLEEVPNNKKFSQGYVLVLDIGAGTTDIALFLDMELIESSKDTFNRGGNTVKSIVSNEIRKKHGYAPTPQMMEDIIRTGRLAESGETHDVAPIVTSAKEQYSKATMEDIRQYLERMSVALPIVKGLLVAGGGALATIDENGNEVSPAMAEVLIQYLKTLAPRLEALDTKGKNLRELNIDGLGTIHKYS